MPDQAPETQPVAEPGTKAYWLEQVKTFMHTYGMWIGIGIILLSAGADQWAPGWPWWIRGGLILAGVAIIYGNTRDDI